MAIQFDSKALDVFRNAQFGNANAIANFNRANGGSLVQKGKLGVGGPIAKMFRSSATEAKNNEVRTELLKALAKTFRLENDTIDEFGGTCFSPEFMDKLSKLLGPAFKREDFEIDRRTGKVASGKPLTARRITAILKQVDVHLDDEFDLDLYAMKLEEIKKEIGVKGLDNKAFRKAMIDDEQLRSFYKVQMCIQFLKGDYIMLAQAKPGSKNGATKTVYGPDGNAKDKSLLFCNPKYQELKRKGKPTVGVPHFLYKNLDTGKYEPLVHFGALGRNSLNKLFGESMLHPERAKGQYNDPDKEVWFDLEKEEDIEPVKKYILNTVRGFVKKQIDVYNDAKAKGKREEFMELMREPGVCIEDKFLKLVEFEGTHLVDKNNAGLSKAEVAELERLADDNGTAQKADKLVYDEIKFLMAGAEAAKYQNTDKWQDFVEPVKKQLRGKVVQVVRPVEAPGGGYKFEPVVKDNLPAVRKLTDDEIDRLVEACFYNVNEGV